MHLITKAGTRFGKNLGYKIVHFFKTPVYYILYLCIRQEEIAKKAQKNFFEKI